MSFRFRKGRASFSVSKRGARAGYRLGCVIPLLAGVVLVMLVTACGNPAGAVPGGGATSRPGVTTTPEPIGVSDDCVDEAGAFFDALMDLDSRLDLGLNFADYSERVGDAKVAYDRIDITELDAACLIVASKGEDAYNAYARAYNTWNDCISDPDCDNDSITPKLQAEWAKATALIEEIKAALP